MSTQKERADLSSPLVSGADAAKTPAARSGAARRFPFLRTKKGIIITVVVVLVIIGGGLAGLAALPKKSKDGSAGGGPEGLDADAVRSDTHFYGESPPVYPSRMLSLTDVHHSVHVHLLSQSNGKEVPEVEKLDSRNGCDIINSSRGFLPGNSFPGGEQMLFKNPVASGELVYALQDRC